LSKRPADVARAIYRAYADKDRPSAEKLIADDFHFTSPLDNRIDRETYFERCWPNSKSILTFEFVRIVPQREQVIVTYEAQTSAGKRFRNTEILTVKDGVITEVEVYFGWDIPHEVAPGHNLEERSRT